MERALPVLPRVGDGVRGRGGGELLAQRFAEIQPAHAGLRGVFGGCRFGEGRQMRRRGYAERRSKRHRQFKC